ncbi:MAG: hypothetical protein BWY63_02603 [Chloroflexi bacterium ADurb.Bin360]|nr:MAG: hypothetical protein BWY63_02603 [Chloroflexi bacterium ADurb.Bin360]
MHRAPIGDDEALQAPFALEDFREQIGLLRAIDAVDPVVGAHHRPGLGFLDRGLESRQVDFAQGTFIHLGANRHALIFLVIGCIVLERGPHTPALDAVDETGSHFASKIGVLGEILEVAPAHRRPLHIDAGSQNHIHI